MNRKIVLPFFIVSTLIIITFLLFNNLENYFSDLLQRASAHRGTFAAVSFWVLASDIVLPVPSSIVMYMNGYILGAMNGSAISLLSLMVSSVAGYYIGKFTSMGLKSKADDKAANILSRYGMAAILISRGIPILSESVCVLCGYNKMPFRQYLILNLVGYIPLCLLYAFCGSLGYDQNTFLLSFACSLVLSALFWFAGKYFIKPKPGNYKSDEQVV